jgi:pilus assembly protein CpaB
VTHERNVQQAQKIILAAGVGRLSLILRQAGEASAAKNRPVTLTDLGLGDAVANKDEDAARLAKLAEQLEEMRKAAITAAAPTKEEALKLGSGLGSASRRRSQRERLPRHLPLVPRCRNVTIT